MKFRVERDALADAVAWTAKSLPSRPSVPVLAGVMLRVADGSCTVSGFDYEVSSQVTRRGAGRRRRRRAGLRPAARRDHQGAAGQAGRDRRRRRAPRAGLRQRPVHAADDAGRGLPDAAGRCPSQRRHGRRGRVRRRGGPGGHRRRPGRDAADDDRRADRARAARPWRCSPPTATGWRCARWSGDPDDPEISLQALVPARTLDDTAKTLGPLGGEVTVALSQRRRRRGHDRLRRRHPAHHQPAARRRELPAGALAVPGPVTTPRPGCRVAALIEVVKRVALVAERTTPVRLSFARTGSSSRPAAARRRGPARRWSATFTGEPLTVGFNPQYLLDGLAVPGRADGRALVHRRR